MTLAIAAAGAVSGRTHLRAAVHPRGDQVTDEAIVAVMESAQELLQDWLGPDCEPGCDCILHPLELAIAAMKARLS